VLQDFKDDLIKLNIAKNVYGIVIEQNKVNVKKTNLMRKELKIKSHSSIF
jgi:hypothetical protein